jgi:hypothetical protein
MHDFLSWRETAYKNLQAALLPHLHPRLAAHVYDFIGGIDDVARGQMGICIRTKMSIKEWEGMLGVLDDEEEEKGERAGYVTQPVTKSVEVRCFRGAVWDTEYMNVHLQTGNEGWQATFVRIEREKGVRMCDIVDELRGVIEADWEVRRGRDDVLLDWRMGGYRFVDPSYEAFDRTG